MPSLSDYKCFLFDLVTGRRTRAESAIAEARVNDCQAYINRNDSLVILDLANGNLRPQMEILTRLGHSVVGIDYVNEPSLTLKKLLYGFARSLFRLHLSNRLKGIQHLRLVYGDVSKLPLKSQSFDLVTSVAAFEHFLDVPAVVSEIERVLRPGGLAWIAIHPFTSLSGGHNVSLRLGPITTMPNGVEPWDHLRKRRLPFQVPLNEWRFHQYLDAFKERFEFVSHRLEGEEGNELLTPDIRAELRKYSVDELTKPSLILVAKKAC